MLVQVRGPEGVGYLTDVTAIAAGMSHSLALKRDGSVWAWGSNRYGQLGATAGSTCSGDPCSLTPIQVQGINAVRAIAAGSQHSLAVKDGETAWTWGWNSFGQLGDNTRTNRASPVQVTGPGGAGYLTGVAALDGGYGHSLARKTDGSVWAWGGNGSGKLGDGTTVDRNAPVQVRGPGGIGYLTDATVVAAGTGHSLVVRQDSSVWAWGGNSSGQLGATSAEACNGAPCSRTPIQAGTLGGVDAIAGGDNFSLALKGDGSVWAWGSNLYGQLGDGTTVDHTTPAQVRGSGGSGYLSDVTGIAAGDGHSLAVSGLPAEPVPPGSLHNPPDLPGDARSHDPVHTLTGGFSYSHVDLAITGRGPSPVFVRAYNSNDSRVTPLGPGWTHSANVRLRNPGDGTGDVVVVGPQGRSDRYTRNADGSYTPPAAVGTALVHGSGVYTATHQDQTVWTFDSRGNLTGVSDRFGNQSVLTYNASNQLIAFGDPAGRGSLTFGYDLSSGRLLTVTDWISRTVQLGYDGTGRLQTVRNRTGVVTTYGYEGTSHRLTTIADANGHVAVTNTYDAQGRVVSQKDARGLLTGQQTTFTYNLNPTTTVVTYPATTLDPLWSPTVEDTYDSQERIIRRVARPVAGGAEDTTVLSAYDAGSNLSAVTDPRGNTTNFCYDVDYGGTTIPGSRGNLTRRIDPPPSPGANRPVTLFQYDGKNNLIQTVPPLGVNSGTTVSCATNLSGSIDLRFATDLVYDATQTKLLSVLRRATDPDLGTPTVLTTTFEYGDAANPGLVTRAIPPRGTTGATPDYTYATSFAYGTSGIAAGMLLTTTHPLGNQTTYGYDAVGRRTSMVDPLGYAPGGVPAEHTWEYVYDDEDRPRFVRTPPPSAGGAQLVTEYRYDAVGNRVIVLDANGQVTKYGYDERDSLQYVVQSPITWTNPAIVPGVAITTEYQYDHHDNLQRVIRAQGDATYERVVDYLYDGLNQLRKETQYPSWPTTSPTLVAEYTYDLNGNRRTVKDPLGQTTTLGYDALNRLTTIGYSDGSTPNVTFTYDAAGNRLTMADGTGTTSYGYDELGRPLTVTTPGPKTVAYRYDRDGNRTKLIYPDTSAVTYSFDRAGRLSSLLDWANRTTSYAYFADGTLKTITHTNGTTAQYAYDNARRLLDVWNRQGSSTISRHTSTLDAAGNRTQVDELLRLLGTGQATAWGSNTAGELGDGTGVARFSPGPVGRLSGVAGIAAGESFSLARQEDGTVWAWGDNWAGQLGDETTTNRSAPVQVSGLGSVTAIAAGYYHGLARKWDGTVWAWGSLATAPPSPGRRRSR